MMTMNTIRHCFIAILLFSEISKIVSESPATIDNLSDSVKTTETSQVTITKDSSILTSSSAQHVASIAITSSGMSSGKSTGILHTINTDISKETPFSQSRSVISTAQSKGISTINPSLSTSLRSTSTTLNATSSDKKSSISPRPASENATDTSMNVNHDNATFPTFSTLFILSSIISEMNTPPVPLDSTTFSSENKEETSNSNSYPNSSRTSNEVGGTDAFNTNSTKVPESFTVRSTSEPAGNSTDNSSSSTSSILHVSTSTNPHSTTNSTLTKNHTDDLNTKSTTLQSPTVAQSVTVINTSKPSQGSTDNLSSSTSIHPHSTNSSVLQMTTLTTKNHETSTLDKTSIKVEIQTSEPQSTVTSSTEHSRGSPSISSLSTNSKLNTRTTTMLQLSSETSVPPTKTSNGDHETKQTTSTNVNNNSTQESTSNLETGASGGLTLTSLSPTFSVVSSTSLKNTTMRPLSFTPNIDNAVFTIDFNITLTKCEDASKADDIEIMIKTRLTENITELAFITLRRHSCSGESKRRRRSGNRKQVKAFTVTAGFRRSVKGQENWTERRVQITLQGIAEVNMNGTKLDIGYRLRSELKNSCRSDVCQSELNNNKGYECKEIENNTGCLIQSICLSENAYCKYGASCEIKVLGNSYQPGCRCEDTTFFTFTGLHCEKKSLKLDVSLYIAGFIGAIIIITFIVIILLLRRSGLKNSVQKEPLILNPSGDGHEEVKDIQSFDNQSYDRDYESNWDIEKSAHTYDYIDTKLSEVNYSMQIKRPKLVNTYY